MKRCPLCDFIYEDNQVACDMDGIELVHDQGALVLVGDGSILKPPTSRLLRPRRVLHLLLAIVLGGLISSAYYASLYQAAPATEGPIPISSAGPPPPPAVEANPEPVAPPPTSPTATPPKSAVGPAEATVQPRTRRPNEKKPRPAVVNKKKESKLASVLNKTGRILKKPFRF